MSFAHKNFKKLYFLLIIAVFILSTSSLQSYNATNNKLVQNSYFKNLGQRHYYIYRTADGGVM